jgi:hypothetical protein
LAKNLTWEKIINRIPTLSTGQLLSTRILKKTAVKNLFSSLWPYSPTFHSIDMPRFFFEVVKLLKKSEQKQELFKSELNYCLLSDNLQN